MSSSSPTSTLNVDVRPGKPPMLRVDAIDDGPREVVLAMADAARLANCSPTIEITAG